MSDFRQEMTVRQVRTLVNALAVLAGVTRHDQDTHAVQITLTTADSDHFLGSLNLGLLPLTEMVDAVRARSTDIARHQKPAQPAAPVLQALPTPTDSFLVIVPTEAN